MLIVPSIGFYGPPPPLLLDGVANLGMVFSLRRLLSTYSGYCCKIRRSSDSAEQDIGFVQNVVDTASIASFIGGGSGYGVKWYNQGPVGANLVQTTSASQCLFVASSSYFGGVPAWRYDGTNDGWVSESAITPSAYSNGTEMTFFGAVMQWHTSAENFVFHHNTSVAPTTAWMSLLATYSAVIIWDWQNFTVGRVTVSPTNWTDVGNILEVGHDTSDNHYIMVNGSLLKSEVKTVTLASSSDTFDVGGASSGGLEFEGDMAELIYLKTESSTAERDTIRASMGDYHSVGVAMSDDPIGIFGSALKAFYEADQEVYEDRSPLTAATEGAQVMEWKDRTVYGLDLVSSHDPNFGPVWNAASFNGSYPALTFAGSFWLQNLLDALDISGSSLTIYVVGEHTGDNKTFVNIADTDGNGSTNDSIQLFSNVTKIGVYQDNDVAEQNVAANTPSIFRVTAKTNERRAYVDGTGGTANTSTHTPAYVNASRIAIGACINSGSRIDGKVASVLVVLGEPTSGQETAVMAYLTAKWGL